MALLIRFNTNHNKQNTTHYQIVNILETIPENCFDTVKHNCVFNTLLLPVFCAYSKVYCFFISSSIRKLSL
jgi:hypothetical protein